jgi:hypothetical protein
MSGGKRPAIKLAAKAKGQGGTRQGIGAAWLNDDGKLAFRLDEGVRIQLADGSVVSGKGKDCTHFVDVYVNETVHPPSEPGRAPQSREPAQDYGGGNDADEIPFARREDW